MFFHSNPIIRWKIIFILNDYFVGVPIKVIFLIFFKCLSILQLMYSRTSWPFILSVYMFSVLLFNDVLRIKARLQRTGFKMNRNVNRILCWVCSFYERNILIIVLLCMSLSMGCSLYSIHLRKHKSILSKRRIEMCLYFKIIYYSREHHD